MGTYSLRIPVSRQSGFSLIETLLVLSLLLFCLGTGGFALTRGLGAVEARGAASAWQAAAAWAQNGAVWQGEHYEVRADAEGICVSSEAPLTGGFSGLSVTSPGTPVTANVSRWRQGEQVAVVFLEGSGRPDSAGSLFFRAPGWDYRVVVRMETGLTVRTRVDAEP